MVDRKLREYIRDTGDPVNRATSCGPTTGRSMHRPIRGRVRTLEQRIYLASRRGIIKSLVLCNRYYTTQNYPLISLVVLYLSSCLPHDSLHAKYDAADIPRTC